MKSFLVISHEFLMQIIFDLPRYRFFNLLKSLFLRLNGACMGKRLDIYPGVWISTGKKLVIGDDVVLAKDVLITTKGGVEIGDRTMIGYGVKIISANHEVPPIGQPISRSGDILEPVIIENDVWIGANSVILPGSRIGQGVVVAAGSVVTKNLLSHGIYGGVPARLIKMRIGAV